MCGPDVLGFLPSPLSHDFFTLSPGDTDSSHLIGLFGKLQFTDTCKAFTMLAAMSEQSGLAVLRRVLCLFKCSAFSILKFSIIFEQDTSYLPFALGPASYEILGRTQYMVTLKCWHSCSNILKSLNP